MSDEVPTTAWTFPPATTGDEYGLVDVGADLEPGTLLTAYRHGLFPMPVRKSGPIGWWAPDPRGTLPLDALRLTKSLRRSVRRFEVRIDTAFADVIAQCADQRRPHAWISPAVRAAYTRLHELGWVHSVEAWNPSTGRLAGGLYGMAIGGLFAGESMFHHETDASKVALAALVDGLRDDGRRGEGRLLDVQWLTPHLASLGAIEIPLERYLTLLDDALRLPPPAFFGGRRQPADGTNASAV